MSITATLFETKEKQKVRERKFAITNPLFREINFVSVRYPINPK